jgi:1-acyl-sn-glycerol-3-phosphate acyltransferase
MLFSFATSLTISIGVAIALLLFCLIGTLISMRRHRSTFVQGFLLGLNALFNRLRWHTRVDRPMPIAPVQGAIIIANHRSGFDPMFLQAAAPRMIHWMVAKEFCVNHWLAPFFRAIESIPAGRGGIDTAAVKQAIRLAESGHLVGIMPEGRINESSEILMPGRPGAALVALRARVPVIPCYIEGAPYNGKVVGPLFMSARVRVTIGDPIDLSEYYGRDREAGIIEELTKRFLKEIARLGGVENYEPQLAGRHWKPDDLAVNNDHNHDENHDQPAGELQGPA